MGSSRHSRSRSRDRDRRRSRSRSRDRDRRHSHSRGRHRSLSRDRRRSRERRWSRERRRSPSRERRSSRSRDYRRQTGSTSDRRRHRHSPGRDDYRRRKRDRSSERSRSREWARERYRRTSPSPERSRTRYRDRRSSRERGFERRDRSRHSPSPNGYKRRRRSRDGNRFDRGGEGHGRGRRGNEMNQNQDHLLMSFPAWAHRQQLDACEISDTGYDAYVDSYKKEQVVDFVKEHWKEDWFLMRFDAKNLVEQAEQTKARRLETSKKFSQLILDVEGDEFLRYCPDRDASPDLARRSRSGEKSEDSLPVGAVTRFDRTVLIKGIPPMTSCSTVMKSVKAAASTENVEVVLSDVRMRHPGFNKVADFNRDAYVIFTDPQDAGKLEETGKVQLEGCGDKSFFVKRMNPVGNRVAFTDHGQPLRIKIDLYKATELAKTFDNTFGLSEHENTGVEYLLGTQEAQKHFEGITKDDDEDAERTAIDNYKIQLGVEKRKLDFVLGYLRHVHLCSYYGAKTFSTLGGLLQAAFLPFLRPQATDDAIERSFETYSTVLSELGEDSTDSAKVANALCAKSSFAQETKQLDSKIDGFLKFYQPDAYKAYIEEMKASVEGVGTLQEDAVKEFCESKVKIASNGNFVCLLHPFLHFTDKESAFQHIQTKNSERIMEIKEAVTRGILLKEFEKEPEKPIPPIPRYAEPRPGRAAHFLGKRRGAPLDNNNISLHPHNQPSQQPFRGHPQPDGPPFNGWERPVQKRKLRTVIDYSDLG